MWKGQVFISHTFGFNNHIRLQGLSTPDYDQQALLLYELFAEPLCEAEDVTLHPELASATGKGPHQKNWGFVEMDDELVVFLNVMNCTETAIYAPGARSRLKLKSVFCYDQQQNIELETGLPLTQTRLHNSAHPVLRTPQKLAERHLRWVCLPVNLFSAVNATGDTVTQQGIIGPCRSIFPGNPTIANTGTFQVLMHSC